MSGCKICHSVSVRSLGYGSRSRVGIQTPATAENHRKNDFLDSLLPRIAIDSVFQTASGGRQLRDLSINYPRLQQEVAEHGLSLVLIADGRGLREARDDILRRLFAGVSSCLTLRQVVDGGLLRDFCAIAASEPPSPRARSLSVLVESALTTGARVTAADLPVNADEARLALAEYLTRHEYQDLVLADSGNSIHWRRPELVAAARSLQQRFDPASALRVFSEIMDVLSVEGEDAVNELDCRVFRLESGTPVVPTAFFVAAARVPISSPTLQEVSAMALAQVPDAKVSILLSPERADEDTASAWRTLQRTLATSVIVLDPQQLIEFATSTQDCSALLAIQLLRQSDLAKTSPFVVNSVTPERMFFGRESEEATLLATLKTNSIALIGGRRIGKTSLMRHAEQALSNAGFTTYFGDCQTVKDWSRFAQVAEGWGASVPETFEPGLLLEIVKQLRRSPEGSIVLLLDEIDHLLAWDQTHGERAVPEAFFRACRTLSQEGHAQFVFSGERVIANRLWDAQSPHWNFARALELRQLDQSSARELILSPIEALQINIVDESTFFDVAWSRTSGHPQLLQILGDKLVRALNDREPSLRSSVSPDDLVNIADTYSYAEQYLESYWGQATVAERLMTILIASGTATLPVLRDALRQKRHNLSDSEIRASLRMLQVYGITDASGGGFTIRLEWFTSALSFYGPMDELASEYEGASA